jgi:hypothetical protein
MAGARRRRALQRTGRFFAHYRQGARDDACMKPSAISSVDAAFGIPYISVHTAEPHFETFCY